ncbi:VOC family protein [Aeromicrobium sp. NPDC092404]|uniref:VOC family protein n=1 Tax=Aeromicrobium sp. NPDC092404 TaxID=3154976 RepID=UPI003434FECA
MSVRFSHANLRVSDPAASVSFYRSLGLEVTGCLQIAEGYYLLYVSAPGDPGVTIELAVNGTTDPDYSRDPGTGHLALAVGDLDAVVRSLREDGINLESEPFHPADRAEVRVCFAVDPDGHRIELIDGEFPTPQDPLPAGLEL